MNLAVVLPEGSFGLSSSVASLSGGNEGHSCTSGNSIQLFIFRRMKLLSSEQNPEECDATDDAMKN